MTLKRKKKRDKPKWFDEYVPEEVSNSSLFKFIVAISSDKKVEVDMLADLEVDYDIIQQQLEETPSELVYWGAMLSELKMQVSKLDRQIKARRGRLTEKIVYDAGKAQVRITDKQVQAIIEADKELHKLEVKLLLMNKHLGKMYFMVDAIRMKSDNIRSLAGFARIEMGQTGQGG